MNSNELAEYMVDILNKAFEADPQAIRDLVQFRASCNNNLADMPHVVTQDNVVVSGNSIGPMGLLNGCLSAAGLNKIAVKWTEPEGGKAPKMLGFCVYKPKD